MLSVPRDLKVTIHPDHEPAEHAEDQRGVLDRGREAGREDGQAGARDQDQPRHRHQLRSGSSRSSTTSGCVYVQVDRRYYHSNLGLAPSQTYDEINIQPGYQKLCGDDALALRALPPRRHGPRAQRAPAGLPAPDQEPDRRRRADLAALRDREDLRQVREHRHPLRATTCSSCSSSSCSRPVIRSGRSSSTPRSARRT